MGNRISQLLSSHGHLNITVLPHPSSYVPGLVMQSVLAEKNIESQLEVSLGSPLLRDNRPHLLIGFDKARPDGLSLTLKMRGEASTIKPGLPLPLALSMILEGMSILGEVARSIMAASAISGQPLYREAGELELFNAKAGYGIEVVERFLAFYSTGDYKLPDSLFATSIPFLPTLTGGDVGSISEFIQRVGVREDISVFDIKAEEGKTLVEEVLKKVNAYAKRIVPSNTLVSFLPLMTVEKRKIDLRELGSALLILLETSPGSIFESLSRNSLYPLLNEYYNVLRSSSRFLMDVIEERKLVFKTNTVIIENPTMTPESVSIRFSSLVLEFLGFISKDHILTVEADGVVVTSKQEAWVKNKVSKSLKMSSVDHMHMLVHL